MADDEAVTLEFLARQLDRVLDRIDVIENQIAVMTSIVSRTDDRLARRRELGEINLTQW